METKKLLVEGHGDEVIVGTLCKYHGMWVKHAHYQDKSKPRATPFAFECKEKQSVGQLLDELSTELDESELKTMGIVVDADTDLVARWAALSDRLQGYGYESVPKEPATGGTIIRAENLPTVGIWVMPDNRLRGMIEDFAVLLIPSKDTLWPYAQKCVSGIAPDDRKFSPYHETKAAIHTWLAWSKKPGTPIGTAINNHYLDADAPQATEFIAWIRRLFEV